MVQAGTLLVSYFIGKERKKWQFFSGNNNQWILLEGAIERREDLFGIFYYLAFGVVIITEFFGWS